ncbi:MAG TPA: Uma2 family endonuclease [Hyphomicrobiaceae bacterium]|nr:Uma2 family endonuclease [Hyphomicrobiaceae bacterium]
MNAPLSLTMTKAEFNLWIGRQATKHEWKEGRVVQMTNVTKAHARIVANLIRALSRQFDPVEWSVTASDLGVEGDNFIRYPDVIVERMDDDDKGRRARQPIVLVEVLSVSTEATDLVEKLGEYRAFASLEAYVVASQDTPKLWVWQRDAAGEFATEPALVEGRGAMLGLSARGISVPLAELFLGVAAGT